MIKQLLNRQDLDQLWKRCPLWTKCVFILSITLSLLQSTTFELLRNDLYQFQTKGQIWRFALSVFVDNNGFSLGLVLLNIAYLFPEIEAKQGTIKFATDFLTKMILNELVMQILFVIILTFKQGSTDIISYGLWGMWFIYISRYCYQDNPDDKIELINWPWKISMPKKFYPFLCLLIYRRVFGAKQNVTTGFIIGIIEVFWKIPTPNWGILTTINNTLNKLQMEDFYFEGNSEIRNYETLDSNNSSLFEQQQRLNQV